MFSVADIMHLLVVTVIFQPETFYSLRRAHIGTINLLAETKRVDSFAQITPFTHRVISPFGLTNERVAVSSNDILRDLRPMASWREHIRQALVVGVSLRPVSCQGLSIILTQRHSQQQPHKIYPYTIECAPTSSAHHNNL